MLSTELREYIRLERSKIFLSRISYYILNKYNDGWCYNCNKPIDLELDNKFCSDECVKKYRNRIENGYVYIGPNKRL